MVAAVSRLVCETTGLRQRGFACLHDGPAVRCVHPDALKLDWLAMRILAYHSP
jgi:hypothetical protein